MDRLEPNPKYINTSPGGFCNPRLDMSFTKGSITHWKGMIMAMENKKKRTEDILFLYRTSTHAAIEAQTMISTVAATVMSSELRNAPK